MPGFELALDAVVVEENGRLVAYAAFIRNDYVDVYVHPEARNRGLGALLLEWSSAAPASEGLQAGAPARAGRDLDQRGRPETARESRLHAGTHLLAHDHAPGGPSTAAGLADGIIVRTFDQERDARRLRADPGRLRRQRAPHRRVIRGMAGLHDRQGGVRAGAVVHSRVESEIVGCVLCPNYEDGLDPPTRGLARVAPPRARDRPAPPGDVRVHPSRPQGAGSSSTRGIEPARRSSTSAPA